jgi:hypothetical protein
VRRARSRAAAPSASARGALRAATHVSGRPAARGTLDPLAWGPPWRRGGPAAAPPGDTAMFVADGSLALDLSGPSSQTTGPAAAVTRAGRLARPPAKGAAARLPRRDRAPSLGPLPSLHPALLRELAAPSLPLGAARRAPLHAWDPCSHASSRSTEPPGHQGRPEAVPPSLPALPELIILPRSRCYPCLANATPGPFWQ